MTRLLFPEAFGLVAAATSLLVGLTLVSDVGIRSLIMRSDDGESADFLRFAWTFQICRGFLIWVFLILICLLLRYGPIKDALPSQSVFVNPQFSAVTSVLGFGLVLNSLEFTAVHLNARRLNLRPVIFLDVTARTIALPAMAYLAYVTNSVWAIVFGALFGASIRLVMTHIFVPGPRMLLRWSRVHAVEFMNFGKWVSLSSAGSFISGQGDRIFIGLLMSSSLLGLYSIAKIPVETILGLFERLNSSLAVPVLGEIIRQDKINLRKKYYRFRLPFDLSAPFIGGALLTAGSLVIRLLYDQRYGDAGILLQILAIGLALFPASLIASAFPLVGEPRISAIVSIVQAASLFICMIVGFYFGGLLGTVFGVAAHRLVPSFLILAIAYQRGWIAVLKELRVVPMFLVGAVAGEIVTAFARYLGFPV